MHGCDGRAVLRAKPPRALFDALALEAFGTLIVALAGLSRRNFLRAASPERQAWGEGGEQ